MANTKAQVITCRAAVSWGPGEPLKVEKIQVEPPKSSEVRVKMLCASLCHTDLLGIKGVYVPLFPRVLGHEGVGIIESIGDNVRKELKEGDLVIPTYLGECKECENCKSKKTNICSKFPLTLTGVLGDGTSRMSIKGQKLYHFFSCSTWSEYMVADSNYVVKIDSRTPLPHASFLSCGYSTGFGAAWKEANIEKGSTVAVVGLGAVGLGVIEGARIQGAAKIIGVDTNEKKLEKGTAFGMTDFINPGKSKESVSDMIKNLTAGVGVDYAFECTGVPSLANEALESTKMGIGVTIIIGAPPQKSISFKFLPLIVGRTIRGSTFGGIKVQSDLPVLVHKCINKETNLDKLLTHEVSLDDISKAFELMKQVDCVKVLIKI